MANHVMEGGAEPRVFSDDDRLRAEIDRFKAESRKLKLEADQIETEMALPFFRRSGFVKAAAAGILALPLIWFYLDAIVIPYQNAKSELLSIQNAKAKEELAKAKEKLDELSENVAARRQELEGSRQKLNEMEAQLHGTLQELDIAHGRERSALENLKRGDREAKTNAKIAQMQDDLTRRDQEIKAAVSSLELINKELARPVPAPLPASPLAPTEAPPMPVISGATVILHTMADDKDKDANVSIAINTASGAVFTWKEDKGEEWGSRSYKKIVLNRVAALPLSSFENATIEICISRRKEHGWSFGYTGSLFIGNDSVLSFEGKENRIAHGAGVSCVGSRLRPVPPT
jgi:hypothetical protein